MSDPQFVPSMSRLQRSILVFIKTHVDTFGWVPSYREIGAAVGLSSTSSVAHQLQNLEDKGFLRREPGRMRAMSVLWEPPVVVESPTEEVAA